MPRRSRAQGDRLLVAQGRFLEPAQIGQGVAQVVKGRDERRFQRDGPGKLGRRVGQLALLGENDSQIVVHFGHVGPNRQNLAIGRRRFGQPPRLLLALGQHDQCIQVGRRTVGHGHRLWLPLSPRSACTAAAMRCATSSQSPTTFWRKSLVLGYQGESSRSRSQRHSLWR